jgi:hypothetical protein
MMRFILMAFILICTVCSAQTPTNSPNELQAGSAGTQAPAGHAALQGRVSDTTGAMVPGATVTASNATGTATSVVTDGEGKFVLQGMAAGAYEITVSSPGFADYKIQGFNVLDWGGNNLDVQLHPAAEVTQVEVAAQSSMQIETEKSEMAGTLTQEQIVTMGLNGRNFAQLLVLTPGVSNQTQQDEAKVGVVGSAKYSVNGGRVEYNSFDVDGSDVLNTTIAASHGHITLSVYPSVDAISETKVLTSNYGAQYGRSASGTILVTTKSGGAALHGNAYEFLRNELLNSRGFKDPEGPAPLYRRQDFGGTLGGPIYVPGKYNVNKDKSFFFFSEEFRLERSPSSFSQAVPSLNEREGDFSDVCPGPDCPQSSLISGSNVPIDPNAYAILHSNLIPLANSSSGCAFSLTVAPTSDPATWPCYDLTVSPSTYWREELFRIDHNLNSSVKGSFRFIHDSWDTTATAPQWQYGGNANSFPTVLNRFVGPGLSMVARLTSVKSASLVNDYSVSFVTQHITLASTPGPGADLTRPSQLDAPCGALITSCGIGSIFPGSGGKIPGIYISGSNAAYGGTGFLADTSYMPWKNADPTITLRDDLSKSLGKHFLQAGVLFLDAQQSESSSATGANTGDVQGLVTFTNVSNLNSTGNAFADFLLANTAFNSNLPSPTGPAFSNESARGTIVSYQQDSTMANYANRYSVLEPYLQDDWHLLPHLTLNLGVRFSLFGNWTPNGSSVYNFVPDKFDTALAGAIQVDSMYGYIKDASTGAPILANAQNPDFRTINGLVECGKDGVPASCMSAHYFNPAPRFGFAWDPTGKNNTSIRAGYGVFFEHGTGDEANSGSLTGSAPLIQSMTQNAPQGHAFRWECIGGMAQGCAATVPAGAAFPLDVSAIPTKTVWPYIQQWSLSVQQQFGRDMVVTLAYVGSKGTHLATIRQLNQLDPVPLSNNYFGPHEPISFAGSECLSSDQGATVIPPQPFVTQTGYRYYPSNPAYKNMEVACTTAINPNSQRKYSGYGRILSVENTVNSSYNALQATVHYIHGPWNLGVSHSYGHSIDEASDRFESALGNSLDPHSNRASSSFDQRHIFNFNYVYKLPIDHLMQILVDHGKCNDSDTDCQAAYSPGSSHPNKYLLKALKGWELSGLTTFQTGSPFTIINGGSSLVSVLDNAGVANGLGAGSYPDAVKPIGVCDDYSVSNGSSLVLGPLLASRCRFVAPRGLTFGNAGRNSMNNPSRINYDAALHRQFMTLRESHLEIRAEAFNLFNHPQYRIYDPEKGNTPSNTISCYGDILDSYSAGASSCNPGNSFLHPVDAHRPRTMQLGVKLDF